MRNVQTDIVWSSCPICPDQEPSTDECVQEQRGCCSEQRLHLIYFKIELAGGSIWLPVPPIACINSTFVRMLRGEFEAWGALPCRWCRSSTTLAEAVPPCRMLALLLAANGPDRTTGAFSLASAENRPGVSPGFTCACTHTFPFSLIDPALGVGDLSQDAPSAAGTVYNWQAGGGGW